MKIIGEKLYTQDEIYNLINKSNPSLKSELTFKGISEMGGWVYVKGTVNETEFSINYSSAVFDTSVFIQFFAELINLKDDIAIILDLENSDPVLYAKKVDNNTLRFIFAHNYNLSDYKIEFDILIKKQHLLKEFYIILHPYLKDYNSNYADYIGFNLKKAKEYMDEIKSYLDKNITCEEKEIIEKRIKEEESKELGEWTEEMLKPENLIGPFETTEEMMKSLWDEDDD